MPSAVIQQLDAFGPANCEQLTYEQANAFTEQLVRSQYENFTVVSWLLPARLRDDFRHIYAFCRWADDLGDEIDDPQRSLELLDWWRSELDRCYAGNPRHPVFVALKPTIDKHDIPRKPFDDLIDAFVQDQTVQRYDAFEQVVDYCSRSANPVGRLVLYACGYRDDERQALSDQTCTALQLANFWQDVRRDVIERNRIYVPAETASKHGLDLEMMVSVIQADEAARGNVACKACPTSLGIDAIRPAYHATIKDLVDRTWKMFEQGRALWPLVAKDIRVDIELFTRGGEAVLRQIERARYDTLTHRPTLSPFAKATLLLRAVTSKVTGVRR